MRRPVIPTLLLAGALAACSGSSPTQAPAATSNGGGGGGGQATEQPNATENVTATQASGGGGTVSKPAGWDRYGKVHVEMTGPVNKSADYGFIPAGSLFGGSNGSSLNFTIDGSNEIVSILVGADNKVIVSYGGTDFSMPAAECTTSNWNIGATSASGSFDCKAALTIMASGASVQGGTIKGTFDAHAT